MSRIFKDLLRPATVLCLATLGSTSPLPAYANGTDTHGLSTPALEPPTPAAPATHPEQPAETPAATSTSASASASASASIPARSLKLATWNMEWLMAENGPLAATAPLDRPRRTEADFAKLASYAQHLNADIIGLQEVDSPATAKRLFPARAYQIFITGDALLQHPALAVRTSLKAHQNPDVLALDVSAPTAPHQLRRGLDVTIEVGTFPLRVLVLHLKTGCWDNAISDRQHNCPTLLQQFAVLQNWINARVAAHEAFVLMGDFNRRLTAYDPFYHLLTQASPLTLTSSGWASPCENGSYFIDHILLGGAARNWLQPHSLRVMTYRPESLPATLSDHCAVSVRLTP